MVSSSFLMDIRRSTMVVVALLLVGVLAACGSSDDGAASGDEKQAASADGLGDATLEIWSPENRTEDGEAHKWLIEQFQKENPGVKVTYTITTWEDHFTRIQAAQEAGNLPDILYTYQPNTASLIKQDVLLPITDVWEKLGVDNFPAAQGEDAISDGEYYSIPFFGVPHSFWYRKDWFDEAGIATPESWDDLTEAARKLTGDGRFGMCLFNKGLDSYYVTDHLIAAGGEPFNEAGDVAINSPATIGSLGWIKTINDEKLTPDGWTAWTMDDAKLPFLAGKCGIKIDSTSFLNALVNDNPDLVDKVGLFPVPLDGGEFAGLAGTSSYAVTKDSKSPEAAKAFLEFMFREDIYAGFIAREVLGFTPVYKPVAEGEQLYAEERIAPYADIYKAAAAAMSAGRPGLPVYPDTASAAAKVYNEMVYAEMGDRVYKGESPEAIAEWAEQRVSEAAGG